MKRILVLGVLLLPVFGYGCGGGGGKGSGTTLLSNTLAPVSTTPVPVASLPYKGVWFGLAGSYSTSFSTVNLVTNTVVHATVSSAGTITGDYTNSTDSGAIVGQVNQNGALWLTITSAVDGRSNSGSGTSLIDMSGTTNTVGTWRGYIFITNGPSAGTTTPYWDFEAQIEGSTAKVKTLGIAH